MHNITTIKYIKTPDVIINVVLCRALKDTFSKRFTKETKENELKKKVVRFELKEFKEGDFLMSLGRKFHIFGA